MSPYQPSLMRLRLPALMFLLLTSIALSRPTFAQQIDQVTITQKSTTTVDTTGNALFDGTLKFNPPRIYDRIKRAYPNLYVMFRDFGNQRAAVETERSSIKVESDDGQRTISFKAKVLGLAVKKKKGWQFTIDKGEELIAIEGTRIITNNAATPKVGMLLNTTNIYALPATALNIKLDKERHLISYDLPASTKPPGAGKPEVDVSLRFKKNLMAGLYKIYADTEADNGHFWVAKAVIRNTGKVPIYNIKVSYRLGEYAESGTSETYLQVVPGGAVIDMYYPIFSSKVADLRTRTPLRLVVKCEYRDAAGKTYSEDITEPISLLGINQFEYSDLSEEDKTDTWTDRFNSAPLLAAFITKLDEPVKKFAGYISEASGGAGAAINDMSAVKWLKAAYEMELVNNIVYQTPSGDGFAQDLKYPRDVFSAKSGTCIDLAILYATLAESVGLKSYLMLIPGHCFAVVQLPGGSLLPVENTGLGGGDKRMSFEDAVKVGVKEFNEQMNSGVFILIDISMQQNDKHVPTPELPKVGEDFLEKCGIKRVGELQNNNVETPRVVRNGENPAPAPKPRVETKVERGGIGVQIGSVSSKTLQERNLTGGVQVTKVIEDTPAATAGLQRNDILLEIDDAKILTLSDAQRSITSAKPGETLKIVVLRDQEKKEFKVRVVSYSESLGMGGGWIGRIEQGNSYFDLAIDIEMESRKARGTIRMKGKNFWKGDFRNAVLGDDQNIAKWQARMTGGAADITISMIVNSKFANGRITGTTTLVYRNLIGVEMKREEYELILVRP